MTIQYSTHTFFVSLCLARSRETKPVLSTTILKCRKQTPPRRHAASCTQDCGVQRTGFRHLGFRTQSRSFYGSWWLTSLTRNFRRKLLLAFPIDLWGSSTQPASAERNHDFHDPGDLNLVTLFCSSPVLGHVVEQLGTTATQEFRWAKQGLSVDFIHFLP